MLFLHRIRVTATIQDYNIEILESTSYGFRLSWAYLQRSRRRLPRSFETGFPLVPDRNSLRGIEAIKSERPDGIVQRDLYGTT